MYRTCDGCRIKRTDTNFVDGFNDNNKTLVELINALKTITTQLQTLIKEQPQSEVESTTAESSPETEKYIIVMDVETNGLIQQRGLTPDKNNLSMFPRIVQFSWALYTETGVRKEIKDYIIKPNGWKMNGKEKYHGITFEKSNERRC